MLCLEQFTKKAGQFIAVFKSVNAASWIPLCAIFSARLLGELIELVQELSVDFKFKRLKTFMLEFYVRK